MRTSEKTSAEKTSAEKTSTGKTSGLVLALLFLPSIAFATDTQLLWGDTHLHTSYSTDAFMAGNRSADPDTAYRLAKGEPVVHPFNRTRVQLQRPLDFLVIADHAESFGVMGQIYRETPDQPDAWFWQKWRSAFLLNRLRAVMKDPLKGTAAFLKRLPPPNIQPGDQQDPLTAIGGGTGVGLGSGNLITPETAAEISKGMWERSVTAADAHNDPGKFSALIGWEWTQTANGVNLHRVVLSTLDSTSAVKTDPVGSDDAPYPEDLWENLERMSGATGARFMAIPHNSNLSKGYMFGQTTLKGETITPRYARIRAEWEPVTEITQIKGDSETHPDLSPDDPFADFETFSFYLQRAPQGPDYKAGEGDYIRSALKRGLKIETDIGVNPYKFGVIGSTDSHTGIASAEEPNFWGKLSTDSIPENKRTFDPDTEYVPGKDTPDGWSMSASGLAAVWATENTRDAIFDAFRRKEVYATTGPRIMMRFFGGWDFDPGAPRDGNLAAIGYANGVSMGGDLANPPQDGAAPAFLVQVVKDPEGANLDRVQIVKGWIDAAGTTQEKIFNVAWSDNRVAGADGKLPPVGNTVNLQTGTYTNTIGETEFAFIWRDPEFDAGQKAFYYLRALQIPTIRHSQLDAVSLAIDTPYEGPATIQERAYSSPIWYSP